jgi:hypothetical protein
VESLSYSEAPDLVEITALRVRIPALFHGRGSRKDLHVVIGRNHIQKAGKIIHLGVYKDWEELDRLMKNFNILRSVVDALPETRNARAFAERHKGKVFLNFYREFQKGHYKWNEGDRTVVANRTESLDNSHHEIMTGQIILPRECEIVREFLSPSQCGQEVGRGR